MPTDAELRTLFRDTPAPTVDIDPAAVIRRSRRRRLPQQLGVGSALALSVAGIGVASFTGLNGLSPLMTAADAPAGMAEHGPVSEGSQVPFSGGDSSATEQRSSCGSGPVSDADVSTVLTVVGDFPEAASAGRPIAGRLTMTNTGAESVSGIVVDGMVSLSRGGEQVWHRDESIVGASVALTPGQSAALDFSFDPVGCTIGETARGETGPPLAPGQYRLSPVLLLEAPDGAVLLVRGPASAITVR